MLFKYCLAFSSERKFISSAVGLPKVERIIASWSFLPWG